MITAHKARWFERLFATYNRNLLVRRFQGLRVCGLEHLKAQASASVPLVLYANHASWWDGLVTFQVGHYAGLDQFFMMEEKQLRGYPLFRRLGCFSVVRDDARAALLSIKYATDLLNDTNRALWIFPQGELAANDLRPLKLFSGTARIISRCRRVRAAPVAMRFEFLDDFRPEAFLKVGTPDIIEASKHLNAKQLTRHLEHRLTAELDALHDDVMYKNFAGYDEVVAPRRRG
ncbi:MAG: lysophospholipid acyltransferase family protein [Pyrinomonadaceae bacterium MAG19_C2-C3]|nr:lysophospholipid acyltransferase family protein [Pyrinomonadaceae bacterium MAG19_C2-C3]